jgi:hypothetical protein
MGSGQEPKNVKLKLGVEFTFIGLEPDPLAIKITY